MRLLDQPWPLKAIWLVLLGEAAIALFNAEWVVAFAALGTAALTLVPIYVQRVIDVHTRRASWWRSPPF